MTRERPGSGIGWLLLGVVAASALFVGARVLARRPEARGVQPVATGRLELAGLAAPLELLRDRSGVPHVRAASERDAYFGLGFAHAQDRPGQLAWLRRAALGRLSEVEGREAVALDREARVLGFGVLGEREAARLAPRPRGLLEAYAAGVDAGLGEWRRAAAPPLALGAFDLGDPWRPSDSLAIAKLGAWALGGTLEESVVLSDLLQRLGGFEAAFFFPPGTGLRALPSPGDVPREASRGRKRGRLAGLAGAGAAPGALRRRLGLHGASIGSAAFVVGGRATRSGRPLLAGDVHAEPTVPGALYLAHLEGGALNVAGAGPPGVPLFWSGFTPDVAWAAAYAGAVVSDLYIESLSTKGSARYHDGDGWRPLDERREEIAVRGAAAERLVVQGTRHGPLVNALLGPGRPPLALRWPGAEPGASVEAFFEVAVARDAAALRDALALHVEPVLAVAYADAGGSAGVQTAGFVPERGLPTGLLPVPGRDPDYEWRGRLPLARLPARSLAAGEGVAVAADGALAPGGAGIEWLWRSGERSARLEALLAAAAARGPVDLRAVAELQRDVRSERAGRVIARALALVGPGVLAPAEREVIALLESWDRASDGASRGAAAYHVFQDRLLRELLDAPLGRELLARYVGLGRVRATDLAEALLAAAEAGGSPLAPPGPVAEAVRRSLRGTWLELSASLGTNREKWTWGRLHPLRFRALLAPAVSDAPLGPFAYAGDAASVQLADYRTLEAFGVSAVASFRFAIDAAALDEALVSFAPGQSEHPGHAHRDDALERWRVGRPGLLATSRLVVEELATERLELAPAP